MDKSLTTLAQYRSRRWDKPSDKLAARFSFIPNAHARQRSFWPAPRITKTVGTSYMIIIMYVNILIISYYMLLLLYYKHLQISSYIPMHHRTSLYIAIYPLYNTIYSYTTPYTPIQQHILLYITIHPYTSPYTPIHNHTPLYGDV